MRVVDAKEQVLGLIRRDMGLLNVEVKIDEDSPDRDEGKILLMGKPARVIHPRDGFYAKINLNWFKGSTAPPAIKRGEFYWYIFALTANYREGVTSYFICDYKQMRAWVLDFDAPLGTTHRDHSYWRGEIIVIDENRGYFRWGDEPSEERRPSRYVRLRNIASITAPKR